MTAKITRHEAIRQGWIDKTLEAENRLYINSIPSNGVFPCTVLRMGFTRHKTLPNIWYVALQAVICGTDLQAAIEKADGVANSFTANMCDDSGNAAWTLAGGDERSVIRGD